ncbi:acetyl/propionyl/methylcrotonyl-CoA carboxylase subunit alpha [Marinobacteraceae bacterium S3BR75-40.1]
MFNKILIANRGEIAVRINRTAQALGYRTVAVYSEADAGALHVREADEAVLIGPAPVGQSYLKVEAILDAAEKTGAEAVHPGYGFLSENADFARACQKAGLVFIGPPAEAIELMGSKRRSKIAMQEAGVPTVPGYEGDDQSDRTLQAEAERIGVPLMIKASAGGGGRGMRLVQDFSQLASEIERARSEARSAFGNDELILEKAVMAPRHIEIQVFADQQGNTVYLWERDCSIQRRHQKVVEEAPSPFVDEDLRQSMGEAAVRAAQACGYVGAGTVEFLVDDARNFYFLEMNTRLQVEHPVTELITKQDLVAWQLNVAQGQPLPLPQDAIPRLGHAIEVRLYAEDPARDYRPQTGQIVDWQPAHEDGVRFDTGVEAGSEVTPFYDPMLAKVVAWGADRDTARRRLIRALDETRLFGVTSNRAFLSGLIAHPVFARGEATTAFIEQHFRDHPTMHPANPDGLTWLLAATLFARRSGHDGAWSNSLPAPLPLRLRVNEQEQTCLLIAERNHYRMRQDDDEHGLEMIRCADGEGVFVYRGVRQRCQYRFRDEQLYLHIHGDNHCFEDLTHAPAESAQSKGSGHIRAAMDGAIVAVNVAVGDRVEAGQVLAVLEAMKMEHPLAADVSGVVRNVHVAQGDQVKNRAQLIEIEPEEEAAQ